MIELNNLGSLSLPDLIKVAYTCSLHGNIETQSLTFHTNIRVPHHSLNCLLKDVHVCKVAEVLLQKCVVEHASCFSTYTEHALLYWISPPVELFLGLTECYFKTRLLNI